MKYISIKYLKEKLCFKILIIFVIYYSIFFTFQSNSFGIDQSDNEQLENVSKPKYIRLPIEGQIKTIDPSMSFDMGSIEITEQLFLGLTNYEYKNSKYHVVPELAVKWSIFDNGKTYRFWLRKDVFWVKSITGEKIRLVNAHDIVWAVHRNIDPKNDAPYASALYILKNAREINTGKNSNISDIGVKAIDDFIIEFNLEYAASYFPSMLAMGVFRPLPAMVIEKFGKKWTEPENIITNGSYILYKWLKRRKIILKINTNYFNFNNYSIPELRYLIVPENFAALDMYLRNRLDIVGGDYSRFSPIAISRINNNPELDNEHFNISRFSVYSYHFNTNRYPVDNLLVRKAITSAINRNLLIDIVTKGGEKPASTFTHPAFLGYEEGKKYYDEHFNPVEAKKYLSNAGFPDGKNFPELILSYDVSDSHTIIANSIKIMLEHYLKINIRLDPQEWGKFIDIISQEDKKNVPHLFRFGWASDYLDANNFLNEALFHSRSFSGWDNKKYDDLLLNASLEKNNDMRLKLYQQAENIMTFEDISVVPIFFETAHYLVKPWIRGWYPMPIGGQHIENWYFQKK